jgi:FkbM family methyltransferase
MNYNIPANNQVKNLNKIYLKYFGYKKDGEFVDVGAYDGISYSNTWGLACAGWKGICYEPVPSFYAQCYNNHFDHDVITIQTCIGNKEGYIDLFVAGVLSTTNDDYLNSEYWYNDYKYAQKIMSKITTLDKSLKEHNVNPMFDVLSLDVEGGETDVLKGFDIGYWKPKMAIVEVQEHHPAKELTLQAPFINDYFANARYEKIYSDEINNIYVKKD